VARFTRVCVVYRDCLSWNCKAPEKTVKHNIWRQKAEKARAFAAMSVEFVISFQSFYDSGLLVSNCSFHPHEPVLACAVEHGTVFLYHQDVTPQTVGSIVPLSKWKETVLNPVSTQYPVSNASCLQWDVSFSFEIVIWLTFSPDSCYVFELKKKNEQKQGGWETISRGLWKRNIDSLESRRMSFIREEKAHGQHWKYSMESNPAQYLR
jgi:hypothetical protein